MKKLMNVLLISILGGSLTLGSYLFFFEEEPQIFTETPTLPASTPVNYTSGASGLNPDFTESAQKSVHSVVHVKNLTVTKSPWAKPGIALQGTGSGVIISPDGYIITNNHVIQNASKLQVTLNNNESYIAEVIGADPESDIALIKIEADDLSYLPFGNSNDVQVGEWVLAVGNPFNLTSTVTAGIVSAKSRNLGMNENISSFIQTDAAVNAGNSGGALVNIRGELIGINTAITSQTGSYVGYAFAVPSNNARKIVEDILEFGDVQQGILGIVGGNIPPNLDVNVSQGVYVTEVETGSGAAKAGILQGDIINQIDNIQIRKFSDLSGYINSKRPNDVVAVSVLRKSSEKIMKVTLSKYETFQIKAIGIEVTNASKGDLREYKTEYGVKISRGLTPQMQAEDLKGIIITEIDEKPVRNIDDVKQILQSKNYYDPISITFASPNGEKQTYIWR